MSIYAKYDHGKMQLLFGRHKYMARCRKGKLLRQPPLPKKELRHSVVMTPTNWTTVSQGWKI
jgi:hypothetical protein